MKYLQDVDLFMGDLTITYNRSRAVEFSFLTLADNEAFLTHAPGRLNEALALVRSFHWEVCSIWRVLCYNLGLKSYKLFIVVVFPNILSLINC